jgi:hypothetical protein
MTKVNVVTIIVHTLQKLTFTHCPPPPPLPLQINSAIDNSQLAYPSTYLSFASKQRERLLDRYVITMSKQYITQRNLALCVFTSVLLLHSSSSRAAVTTSASLSVGPRVRIYANRCFF